MAERAWIRGAQQGSVADLERLFREHWPRAYRAAHLVTGDAAAAEDIAQEGFLAAIRKVDPCPVSPIITVGSPSVIVPP